MRAAYLRAIQADYSISALFRIASDNYRVGQVGDMVKDKTNNLLHRRIQIQIKDIKDFWVYKVDYRASAHEVGFEPRRDVTGIIGDLHEHREAIRRSGRRPVLQHPYLPADG